MKLLLDENLSRRLVPFLQDAYPETSQAVLLGLEQADDLVIRQYALQNDFVIVTRDADFYEISLIYGQPAQAHLAENRQSIQSGNHRAIITKQRLDHACVICRR
jgi:predicted nuclease of predicted toxin-antitoxin system